MLTIWNKLKQIVSPEATPEELSRFYDLALAFNKTPAAIRKIVPVANEVMRHASVIQKINIYLKLSRLCYEIELYEEALDAGNKAYTLRRFYEVPEPISINVDVALALVLLGGPFTVLEAENGLTLNDILLSAKKAIVYFKAAKDITAVAELQLSLVRHYLKPEYLNLLEATTQLNAIPEQIKMIDHSVARKYWGTLAQLCQIQGDVKGAVAAITQLDVLNGLHTPILHTSQQDIEVEDDRTAQKLSIAIS